MRRVLARLAPWRPWRLGGSNPLRRRVDKKSVNRQDAKDAKEESSKSRALRAVFVGDRRKVRGWTDPGLSGSLACAEPFEEGAENVAGEVGRIGDDAGRRDLRVDEQPSRSVDGRPGGERELQGIASANDPSGLAFFDGSEENPECGVVGSEQLGVVGLVGNLWGASAT